MAHRHKLGQAPKYADGLPWRDNTDDVRKRLMDAAWNALLTKDLGAISLREVAQEVGVSAPAAYNHFKDKEDLFAALASGALTMLMVEVGDLWPDLSLVKGKLQALSRVWLAFAKARPRHYAMMFSSQFTDPEKYPQVASKRTVLKEFFGRLIAVEAGISAAEPGAEIIFAILHGAASLIAAQLGAPSVTAVSDALEIYVSSVKEQR